MVSKPLGGVMQERRAPGLGRTASIMEAPLLKLTANARLPADVISLGQGVPFFGPPSEAVVAAGRVAGSQEGFCYTRDEGLLELRVALSKKLQSENGISADPADQIMVTSGSNQGFINALLAISEPGDEVIVFSPYYFNHVMAMQMSGCKPVFVDTDRDHQPDLEALGSALSERTKAIITISPNNPTGAVYSTPVLGFINSLCRDRGIYHISDEAYEYFHFEGSEHFSPGSLDPGMSHTISLFSFSKSYGMPGYRVGYVAYPAHLHKEMLKVQDTIAICSPALSQHAALAALEVGSGYPRSFLGVMQEVRDLFKTGLSGMDGVRLPRTFGGFYFMLDLDTDKTSSEVALSLMENYGVITAPREMFGGTTCALRISYANIKPEKARVGLARLKDGLSKIL